MVTTALRRKRAAIQPRAVLIIPTMESAQDQSNDLFILILVLKRGRGPNVQEDARKGARIDQSQEVVMQARLALDEGYYSLWNLPTPRGGGGWVMGWCSRCRCHNRRFFLSPSDFFILILVVLLPFRPPPAPSLHMEKGLFMDELDLEKYSYSCEFCPSVNWYSLFWFQCCS